MDDVLAGWYTGSEIQGINPCRLFLQIECLSNICTAGDVRLDPGIQAKPPAVTSTSTIKRPCQGLPGPRSWAIWHRLFKTYTRDSSSNLLRQSHGRNPTFGIGVHTTTHPHKCSACTCLRQQLQRLTPLPLGSTTQPNHAHAPISRSLKEQHLRRRTSRNRCGTRHDSPRDSHTDPVFTPNHSERSRGRHNTHYHKYCVP
jgi:hypothetical protein